MPQRTGSALNLAVGQGPSGVVSLVTSQPPVAFSVAGLFELDSVLAVGSTPWRPAW